MNIYDFFLCLIFSVVQGLTEFLPVSSSGHLVVIGRLFPASFHNLSFDIFLHFATFVAVLVFFRKEIINMFQKKREWIIYIIAGSVPAGVVGLLVKKFAESYIEGIPLLFLSLMFFFTSFMVYIGGKKALSPVKSGKKSIDLKAAVLIGIIQAAAIMPGVSRSGMTISAALLLGIEPYEAFVFSFLLSIPAVGGAFLLDLMDNFSVFSSVDYRLMIFSFVATFAVGYAALVVLRKTLIEKIFFKFSYYTVLLGTAVLALGFFIN